MGAAVLSCFALACRDAPPVVDDAVEPWSVTAWGERYEIFPEVEPLIAGEGAPAHTHVTVLDGFSPLTEGEVEIVLRGGGAEEIFGADSAVRPGIFNIELKPSREGDFDLAFRIRSAAGPEEIAGGVVHVGTAPAPGGVRRTELPPPPKDAGEPLPFLKEQQWRTPFATAWVRSGTIAASVRGLARVIAPAGGDVVLTAPLEGVMQSSRWPHPGQTVRRGDVLFEILPRVAPSRSLPELEGEVVALEAATTAAHARLARLEGLLEVEAVSRREVEDAKAQVTAGDARLEALRRDLAAAAAAREGRSAPYRHAVRAPFDGAVAAVEASPGAAVAPGDALGRIVRSGARWLEVNLTPADARRVKDEGGVRGVVIGQIDGAAPLRIGAEQLRLVSIAPAVDPATGTVTALIEVESDDLVLGVTVDAEVLLAGERRGVVVPATAIVDDGGEQVAYLQLSGEAFARQRLRVIGRQGDTALVEGLAPGQRLVVLGGDAIRRATLLSKGAPEGHVH